MEVQVKNQQEKRWDDDRQEPQIWDEIFSSYVPKRDADIHYVQALIHPAPACDPVQPFYLLKQFFIQPMHRRGVASSTRCLKNGFNTASHNINISITDCELSSEV